MSQALHDPRLLVAAGARATETLLLGCLEPLVAAARADWRLLARPVRIVVPSRSLRDHLSAATVRRFGAAVAGLEIQTLHGLARELLERVHAPAAPGEALLPILVRAAARREPVLARELGALHDGFGAVVGSVRDLLDAGRIRESAAAAQEVLAGLSAAAADRERACALVRVACEVTQAFETLGIDSRASLLGRAHEALRRDPERALPQRAVFVHGFADATGVATDLIEALVRDTGATVLLDRPPDPADPARPDPGCAFTARLAARIESAGVRVEEPPLAIPAPAIELLEAPGGEAEMRGIAVRIRAQLDAGVAPESIGVVARTLGRYALRLRIHFDRLGIPFSALRARGGLDGTGRRIRALLSLLERGGETPADTFLDTLAPCVRLGAPLADLRMALHTLGAARLDQVATLDVDRALEGRSSVPLPVRHGISQVEGEDGETTPLSRRRSVDGRSLAALVDRAQRLRAALATRPEAAPLGEHLVSLRSLVALALDGSEADAATASLLGTLAQLEHDLPADVRLDRADLLLLMRDACEALGSSPLGGAGAGVQLLDATEARARTFEHLFVVGLGREQFPRVVLEDPLLPDAVRAALQQAGAGVLPDLPLKLGGYDEERYLFAQLLSSSPHVTLSWQCVDDDGKPRAVSTLVERLRLEGRVSAAVMLPTLWSASAAPSVRPAAEHLVLAGLHGSRERVSTLMPLAIGEAVASGAASGSLDVVAVARARMIALEMLEPRGAARGRLGPGLGFVGERREGDLRAGTLAVTTLERLARCPWQAFLTRVLHLELGPDALEALAAVDALLLGSVLHAGIEEIVGLSLPERERSLAAACQRGARPARWPSDTDLRQMFRNEAERLLSQEGLVAPGLARVLAERAEPLAREVSSQVWLPAQGTPALFGAELTGSLHVRDDDGCEREISFRADLAQEDGGRPRLIDLKTGKSITDTKTPKSQRGHLLHAIGSGKSLQAAAYACAVGGEGLYLYADTARAPVQRLVAVSSDDAELVGLFEQSLRTLLAAWDRGSFLPRLVLPEGAKPKDDPCKHCEVSEACTQSDTGACQRLRRWAAAGRSASGTKVKSVKPGSAAAALSAARAIFELPATDGAPDASPGGDETE